MNQLKPENGNPNRVKSENARLNAANERPSSGNGTTLWKARFHDLIDMASDWYWETGPDHRFTFVSERIEQICGIRPQDVLGKTRLEFVRDFGIPGDEAKWKSHLDDLDHYRPFRDFRYRAQAHNGEVLYFRISGKPYFGADGEFLGYRGCGTDDKERIEMREALHHATKDLEQRVAERTRWLEDEITERRRVEAALRDSEKTLRAVLDYSPVAIYFKDTQGRLQLVNRKCEEYYGPRDKIVGRTIGEILGASADTEEFTSVDERVLDSLAPYEYETVVHWPDGTPPTDFLTLKFPIFDDNGEFIGLCGFDMDISQRKRADEELRRLRNLLANIVNSMPSVLVGVDGDGRVTQWNQKAVTETGVSADAALGQPLDTVYPRLSGELDRVRKSIRSARPFTQTKVASQTGGEVRYDDITVYPLVTNGIEGAVIRVDDVTERVHIEEMMIHTEKMLSIGSLTAGIAHEINNPLAGILQNAQLARNRLSRELPKNREAAAECGLDLEALQRYLASRGVVHMLDTIVETGRRAARIVANMLAFSRKSEFQASHQDLGALLDQTLELLASDYDLKEHYDFRSIRIQRDYDETLPPAPCEPNQIQQVFVNLLRNASYALHAAQRDEPCLALRTYRRGNDAYVEIKDNGIGMSEQTQYRVFEPFFTTKEVGSGTGLGLSVSYFIITQNHGGDLSVASTPGVGTRFTIRLPLARDEP